MANDTHVENVGGTTTTDSAAWQREIQQLQPATRSRNPAGTKIMYDVPGEAINYLLQTCDQIEHGSVSGALKLVAAIRRTFPRVAD